MGHHPIKNTCLRKIKSLLRQCRSTSTSMNILILTAMKIESDAALKNHSAQVESLYDGHRIVGKNTVFVMESGVGPVSSGIICEKYLTLLKIDLVVLAGLAGAVDSSLYLGDHVVVGKVFQHDAICEFENRVEYMSPGELHLSLKPEERKPIYLESNIEYSNLLYKHLENGGAKVCSGDVASGSSFIGKKSSKLKIREAFPSASIVEMEGIGVALAAKKNNVPFVIVKTVADTLGTDSNVAYCDYVKSEKEKCANIISYFL